MRWLPPAPQRHGERPYRTYGNPDRRPDVPAVCPSHPADVPPASYVRSDLARGPKNSHRRRGGERRRRRGEQPPAVIRRLTGNASGTCRDPRQVPPGFRTGTDTHAACTAAHGPPAQTAGLTGDSAPGVSPGRHQAASRRSRPEGARRPPRPSTGAASPPSRRAHGCGKPHPYPDLTGRESRLTRHP